MSEQPLKASSPILVTLFGMVTVVKLQAVNALLPILVTLFGIVTEAREVHWVNVPELIFVRLFGMVTEVSLVQ